MRLISQSDNRQLTGKTLLLAVWILQAVYLCGQPVTLALTAERGEPGSNVNLVLLLHSEVDLYGLQAHIQSSIVGVIGFAVSPTQNADFGEWEIKGRGLDGGYGILAYDRSLANPISQGAGPVMNLVFNIDNTVPPDTVAILRWADLVISDRSGLPITVQSIPGKIYTGSPGAEFWIGDVVPIKDNSQGSFTIHVDNSVAIYRFSIDLLDIPYGLQVVGIRKENRFSQGFLSPGSGETSEGGAHISGSLDTLTSGIPPGSGPIFTVVVQGSGAKSENILLLIDSVMAFNKDSILISSFGSGYGLMEVELGLEEELGLPPENIHLVNYPNPFNPVTNIRYETIQFSHVNLIIMDMLGREVAVLVNRDQAPGMYMVRWDASNVSSGLYFVDLTTGNSHYTHKVIVLK